jgi:HPt (histidine-containing phosphotransfer) domain-containing protein
MEMRESFRAPFLEMAWKRHTRIAELVGGAADAPELRSAASELHCLSGEASMLAFTKVADIARDAEVAAKEGDKDRVRRLVMDLADAIKAVADEGRK